MPRPMPRGPAQNFIVGVGGGGGVVVQSLTV